MVDLGKLAGSVRKVVDTQGDKVATGVEKATNFVDQKTGGRYRAQLDRVEAVAHKLDRTRGRGPDAS